MLSTNSELELLPVAMAEGIQGWWSTARSGQSQGSYAHGNLGLHVGDDPDYVLANRAALAGSVGAPVQFVNQVHGTEVFRLDEETVDELPEPSATEWGPTADALITRESSIALAVLVADCVPVLFADPRRRVVAAAHAGRRGLLDGIVQRTIEAMVQSGSLPTDITVSIGPHMRGCCYEVPESMQQESAEILPGIGASTSWGTPSLELSAGIRVACAKRGVENVLDAGLCTGEDERFFSYRRSQGQPTGRFAGIVRLAP